MFLLSTLLEKRHKDSIFEKGAEKRNLLCVVLSWNKIKDFNDVLANLLLITNRADLLCIVVAFCLF